MTSLNPTETALLVVHLQHDIVSAGTAFGSLFSPQVVQRDVIAQCARAMQEVRSRGGTVVPLRIAFKEDYSNLNPSLPLLQMVEQAGCLKEGTKGARIVSEIPLDSEDLAVTHQRPGPFTGTDLHEQLGARNIRNVVVCGVATNASVEAAARQASDQGYSTFVLSDASSAADEAVHEASLASMGLIAQVLTVQELTDAIAS